VIDSKDCDWGLFWPSKAEMGALKENGSPSAPLKVNKLPHFTPSNLRSQVLHEIKEESRKN